MNRSLWMMLAGLVALTIAVYWPVRNFGLVDYDDITYLVEDPIAKGGLTLDAVRDAFTYFRSCNYIPIVFLSYCLDQNLFHLRPGPMHVENVVLHLICGLLLWRLIFIATGRLQRGFVIAALFLCHPMHVESVAWLSERKDVLSTAWLLGAMLAYVNYVQQKQTAKKATAYAALLALYTLSLLSKSMGVTLWGVLLLMDIWPLKRWPQQAWVRLLLEKTPLIVLSAVFAVITAKAQWAGGSVTPLGQLSLASRIANALICYPIYLSKLLLPVHLAVFYPRPLSYPLVAMFASAALILLITCIVYRMRGKSPFLMVGWLWFIFTLLPVIGLVQVGAQAMADRYTYFPAIGLFIAATWWVSNSIKSARPRQLCSGLVILGYSVLAHQQVTYWSDTKTLFTHALAVTEDNYLAHEALAADAYAHHDLPLAFDHYQRAIQNWQDPRAYHGLGNCWMGVNDAQAIYNYQRAVELLPTSVNYRTDLASALRQSGRLPEAKMQAEAAVQVNPRYAPAQVELVNILAQLILNPDP